MTSRRVPFMSTSLDALTLNETVAEIVSRVQLKQTTQHVVLNAGKMILMNNDSKLCRIVNSCDIINADGMAIVWASKFLGHPLPERVTGIDLMQQLLLEAQSRKWRCYFLGAQDEALSLMLHRLDKEFPSLIVAGARDGYFLPEEEDDVVEAIAASESDILFVGFSSPKKEYFLHRHLLRLNVPFSMGVGGAFDIMAGLTQRAPLWMQHAGLEWLYRLIQEPRRMFKRYLYGNSLFILSVLMAKVDISSKRMRIKRGKTN